MLTITCSPQPTLETERLVLRPIRHEDKEDLFAIRSNPETMRYVPRPVAQTVEDVLPLIDAIQTAVKNDEGMNWVIALKGSDKLIGMVGYVHFTKPHYRGEVGYILHSDYHNKGIMREAMAAVLDYGFNVMKLHSIEAIINPANTASMNVVEKCGFTKDAHFKDYLFHNGRFADALVYSLINPSQPQV